MPDLMDSDRTEAREKAYPNQVGQLLGQFGSAYVEQANIALDKAQTRVIDLLGRPNVKTAARVSLLDGTDLTIGLSQPAFTTTNLRPRGPQEGTIKGNLRVREVNKAKSNDKVGEKWNINGGIGTALWHVDTSLDVDHSHSEDRSRETDYSSYVEWEMKYGEYEVPEGVAIIQEGMNLLVREGMKINLALAQRKIDALNSDESKLAEVAPDKGEMPEDGKTAVEADPDAGGGDSGGGDGGGDDTGGRTDPDGGSNGNGGGA